jgi:hypothetical protein
VPVQAGQVWQAKSKLASARAESGSSDQLLIIAIDLSCTHECYQSQFARDHQAIRYRKSS